MNPIRTIRRLACILAGFAASALALAATGPAALAVVPAPAGGSGPPARATSQIHTIVTGGMPGWQITLIAAAAALLAATLAVYLDRTLAARRRAAASPA